MISNENFDAGQQHRNDPTVRDLLVAVVAEWESNVAGIPRFVEAADHPKGGYWWPDEAPVPASLIMAIKAKLKDNEP